MRLQPAIRHLGSNTLPMIAFSPTRKGERWIKTNSLLISLLCRTVTLGRSSFEHVQSRILDPVAVLSYDANETETIFGQKLSARYHITDTWLRGNGNWQIVASQAHRYYEDPAPGKADPKKFADFIGTYELASGQIRTVLSEGGSLFVERNGKRDQLSPETSDLFFRKGIEGRILFRYDKNGKVDALIDRRNNEDVVWRKKT